MFKRLREIFTPFAVIAQQLTRLADLKELELRERMVHKDSVEAPIIRITEEPQKGDTTVSYENEDKPKSRLHKMMEGIVNPDEDDDSDPLEEDTLT